MQQRKDYKVWLPLTIAVSVIFGILVGVFTGNPFAKGNQSAQSDRKLNTILNLISQEYIDDSVSSHDLTEMAIPLILANLDPHSSYLSARETRDEQDGSLAGIDLSLFHRNDTIVITQVIPDGPSDKAGIMPGDKIISINDSTCVGPNVDVASVRQLLRGARGTKVRLGILREGSSSLLNVVITRGNIPRVSIDAYYMIDATTGYVKMSQFLPTTHNELVNALNSLKNKGARRFMVDLRGNGGGNFNVAVTIANEFLPEGRLIVSTRGRYRRDNITAYSDGNGHFQDEELIVLINEFSASASEILAGAIQDNDRGLIVGCRSFGKGLVQKVFDLPDKSTLSLSTARYYTPSGRCIQRPYGNGQSQYSNDFLDRYSNGELFSRDSIKIDKSKVFETSTGRKVYGGGGIIPDIFVARDTAGHSSYYDALNAAGLVQEFALKYATERHERLSAIKDYKKLQRLLPSSEELLSLFAAHIASKGVTVRWHYLRQSQDLITTAISAAITRNIFGQNEYYSVINRNDKTIEAANKAFNKHKAAFPITQ